MGAMLSSLRQRRNQVHPEPSSTDGLLKPLLGSREAAPDGGATEPLLGEPRPHRAAAEERELPWPLAAVWHSLQAAWRWLAALLHRLLHHGAPPQLSLLQQERLGRLRQRAAEPYDAEAAEHQVRFVDGRSGRKYGHCCCSAFSSVSKLA